jgi:hypothetical protein
MQTRTLALLPVAFVIAACGAATATSNAVSHTSSAAARSSTPAPTQPPGGPVPAQLIGDWVLMPLAANPDSDVDLIVNATTFSFSNSGETTFGKLVVNGTEIDFFNGDGCGLALPDGVGHYRWTLQAGVLYFSALGEDPCSMRGSHLAGKSYSKHQ